MKGEHDQQSRRRRKRRKREQEAYFFAVPWFLSFGSGDRFLLEEVLKKVSSHTDLEKSRPIHCFPPSSSVERLALLSPSPSVSVSILWSARMTVRVLLRTRDGETGEKSTSVEGEVGRGVGMARAR